MNPKFPVIRRRVIIDMKGRTCIVDVTIEQTDDVTKYPSDGLKCVFRMLREKVSGEEDFELVLLIDNHEPFGFHQHNQLPEMHDSRRPIKVVSWEEAWSIFDKKMKELLDEEA